jgi:hypothetical protein
MIIFRFLDWIFGPSSKPNQNYLPGNHGQRPRKHYPAPGWTPPANRGKWWRKLWAFKTCFVFALVLIVAPLAMAETVQYAWDHNDPLPEGYRVFIRYAGETYDYTAPDWEGAENISGEIEVDMGKRFFAVARAFDGEFESADSNEIEYAIIEPVEGMKILVLFSE